MTITDPSDIPTLADLYTQGELPELEDKPAFAANEALNQRVSIWRGEQCLNVYR